MDTTSAALERCRFVDMSDAGRALATRAGAVAGGAQPVVVGIAPDSMVLAAEVACALAAALETVAVEPLELGSGPDGRFGAAAEGGSALFRRDHVTELDINAEAVDAEIIDTQRRLQRLTDAWHRESPRRSLAGRDVLLVGEPLTDEQLIAAAACAVRDRGAIHVTYVSPLVAATTATVLTDWVDDILALETLEPGATRQPSPEHSESVTDEQVRSLLAENAAQRERHALRRRRTASDRPPERPRP